LRAVDKVTERLESRKSPVVAEKTQSNAEQSFVFIKDGTKLVKVVFDDILYVEGLKDYVTIHLKNNQKIVSLQRLKALEDQLPTDKFIRIHNSFIVALQAIEVVHKNNVQIHSAQLPIGETYKKGFRDFIEKNKMQ
jgi:two-component system LytT family response regulator